MSTVNFHRMEWKAKKQVMMDIIKCGGTIFGGAVRDWFIHDYYAGKYYEEIADKSIPAEKYLDESFLPEFKNRLIIPKDIDATIHIDELEKIKKVFTKNNFEMRFKFDRKATDYIPNIFEEHNTLRHRRYEVRVVPNNIYASLFKALPGMVIDEAQDIVREFQQKIRETFHKDIVFDIDLLIVTETKNTNKNISPPFGPLDFECNGLIANSNGLFLSELVTRTKDDPMSYHHKYNKVINDILHMRAVIANRGYEYRTKKMLEKGWDIVGFSTMNYIKDSSYDGYCIICHESMDEKHYKMKCCDARYHLGCAIQVLTHGDCSIVQTNRCIMCKHRIPFVYGDEDSMFLKEIHNFHNQKRNTSQSATRMPSIEMSDSENDSSDDEHF